MKKKTIILVDDEKDITELYNEYLSDQFDVIDFNSPKDFLEYLSFLKEVQFDLVVSDFNMPKMSGLEMIKKGYEAGHHFPFILFSGHMDLSTTIKAVELGTYRLIEKSCGPDKVLQVIKEVLLESEYHQIRREIRLLTDQMREYYSGLRLIMNQYIPADVMKNLCIEIKDGSNRSISCEDLLLNLEQRLDQLMTREESLQSWMDRKKAS
jgi:two-component system probable response regulator PhcQ